MASRLLHRQVCLLEYLTHGAVIFGGSDDVPLPRALVGIDRALLNLEARFSHQKRMDKIAAVFPLTIKLLDRDTESILRSFTEACPPTGIARLENARQFHDFLRVQLPRYARLPAHLADVAGCELAFAQSRAHGVLVQIRNGDERGPRTVRRHPNTILLCLEHDVRELFETRDTRVVPTRRNVCVAVALPPGMTGPKIFDLPRPVFELLAAMDNWSDPEWLAECPELEGLVRALIDQGLIEARL
jgi:hypothetical protein